MIRRPPRSTRTDPLFPYTTLFRSARFERVDLQGQGIRLQPLPGGVVPVSTPEPSAPDPRGQIKTRQRVRDLAEVFTHEREVKAMLDRSEEHTSELQSLMRISYAVFCLKKKKNKPSIQLKQNN